MTNPAHKNSDKDKLLCHYSLRFEKYNARSVRVAFGRETRGWRLLFQSVAVCVTLHGLPGRFETLNFTLKQRLQN